MHCQFDLSAVNDLKSPVQKARVLTENWVLHNVYCPRCGQEQLSKQPNNQPVSDYICPECHNEYELKSCKRIGRKIADGAYSTFVERINGRTKPDFFILKYDGERFCAKD